MNLKEANFSYITICVLWVLINLSACHPKTQSQVEFNHDEVNLQSYRVFSWPDDKPMIKQPNHIDLNLANQIKQSVMHELTAKGYRFKLNPTSADFIVSYTLSSSNDKNYEPASTLEIENEKCIHPLTYSFNLPGQELSGDLHSKMILSIYDVRKCVVVWQARVDTAFDPHKPNVNQEQKINSTVTELLKKFPAKDR